MEFTSSSTIPDVILKYVSDCGVTDRRQAFFKRDPASAWADGYICCKMIRKAYPTILEEIAPTAKSTLQDRISNWCKIKDGLSKVGQHLKEEDIQRFAHRDFSGGIIPYVIDLKRALENFGKTNKGKSLTNNKKMKDTNNRRPSMTNYYLERADMRKMVSIRAAVMTTEEIEKQFQNLKSDIIQEATEIGTRNKQILSRTDDLSKFLNELRARNLEELKEVEEGIKCIKLGIKSSSSIPIETTKKSYNVGPKRVSTAENGGSKPTIIDQLIEKNLRNHAELQMNNIELGKESLTFGKSTMDKYAEDDEEEVIIFEDVEPFQDEDDKTTTPQHVFSFDATELLAGKITHVRTYNNKQGAYYYTDVNNAITWDMPTQGIVRCVDDKKRTFYVDAASKKSGWKAEDVA